MDIIHWLKNLTQQIVNSIREIRASWLYNRGVKQYQNGLLAQAFQTWEKALILYKSIGNEYEEVNTLNCIGLIYKDLGKYQQAQEHLEKSLLAARRINYRIGEANSLGNLSNVHRALGDYPQAIEYLEKSLTISQEIEDWSGVANSLCSLGNIYQNLGQPQQALEYREAALIITRQIGDRIGEVDSIGNLGISYLALGRYQEAISWFEQSLSIARETAYLRGEFYSTRFLGNTYLALGQYQKAIEYLEQSLTVTQATGDMIEKIACLDSLGSVYHHLGRYQKVIDYRQQSISIARETGNREAEAVILGNLGSLYDSLGEYELAIEYYQQSLIIVREIGDRQLEGTFLGSLGSTYHSLGQYQQAIEYQQQSLNIAREIRDRQGEGASLNDLGITYQSLNEYEQAVNCHQQALEIAREISDRQQEANSLGCLGNTSDSLGQHQQAIEYHQQYLDLAVEMGNDWGKGAALNNLGDTLLQLGQLAEAEQKLLEAVQVWESLRTELREDLHKVSIFDTQTAAYSLLQEVMVAQDKSREALEISERGRTRAFVELLTQRSSISFEKISGSKSPQTMATPPTAKQIERIAKFFNSVLVEYSIIDSGNFLLIWVIEPTGKTTLRQVDLKFLTQQNFSLSDVVAKARESLVVGEIQQSITSNVKPEFSSHRSDELQQLYQILIRPIIDLLPSNPDIPVIFIPQGTLFLLPFAGLQNSDGKFLIEQHVILIAPSIQVLDLLCQHKESVDNKRCELGESTCSALVVGNPKMPTIPLTEPPVELRDLAWAKTEANAIAPLLNTQAITGADATKAHITQLLPKARLIHFATHGLLDDIRQLGIPGAIALAPSDEDNGFLTSGEIYDMKLNAELVVLSACSTGQGKITGDGVIAVRSLIFEG